MKFGRHDELLFGDDVVVVFSSTLLPFMVVYNYVLSVVTAPSIEVAFGHRAPVIWSLDAGKIQNVLYLLIRE